MYEGLIKLAASRDDNKANNAALFGTATGVAGGAYGLTHYAPTMVNAYGRHVGLGDKRYQDTVAKRLEKLTKAKDEAIKGTKSKKKIKEIRSAFNKEKSNLEKKVQENSKTVANRVKKVKGVSKWFKKLTPSERALGALGLGGATLAGGSALNAWRNRNNR